MAADSIRFTDVQKICRLLNVGGKGEVRSIRPLVREQPALSGHGRVIGSPHFFIGQRIGAQDSHTPQRLSERCADRVYGIRARPVDAARPLDRAHRWRQRDLRHP